MASAVNIRLRHTGALRRQFSGQMAGCYLQISRNSTTCLEYFRLVESRELAAGKPKFVARCRHPAPVRPRASAEARKRIAVLLDEQASASTKRNNGLRYQHAREHDT
jgi:hypothetical protein